MTSKLSSSGRRRRWTASTPSGGSSTNESLHAVAKDLNDREIPAPRGGRWNGTMLRQVVTRERNAGLRRHQGRVLPVDGPVRWEPIVTEDEHRRLVALLTDPARRTNVNAPRYRYLLGGIVRCGRCAERGHGPDGAGTRLRAVVGGGQRRYVCPRCYLGRDLDRVDDLVTRVVVGRLAKPDALAAVARHAADDGAVRGLTDRRDALRAKLALADDDYADDKITREQHLRITQRTRPKLDEVEAALRAATRAGGVDLSDLARPDVAQVWKKVTLERRRAVIDALVTVTVLPVGSGARWREGSDEDAERHVRIEWRNRRP